MMHREQRQERNNENRTSRRETRKLLDKGNETAREDRGGAIKWEESIQRPGGGRKREGKKQNKTSLVIDEEGGKKKAAHIPPYSPKGKQGTCRQGRSTDPHTLLLIKNITTTQAVETPPNRLVSISAQLGALTIDWRDDWPPVKRTRHNPISQQSIPSR